MGRQLILLGIIHTDPQGRPRLDQALRQYDPKNITFELLNCTYFWFSREEQRKLSHLIFECTHIPSYPTQRKLLEKLLEGYGYEERIATQLERSKKRRIYRIDSEVEDPDEAKLDGESNRTVLPTISGERAAKQVAIANMVYRKLEAIGVGEGQGEILAEHVSYTYFSSEELMEILDYKYEHLLEEITITPNNDIFSRDQTMEQRIREIWDNSEGTLLHVSGLYHVYEDYPNLFERLQDLHPERHRLNEF